MKNEKEGIHIPYEIERCSTLDWTNKYLLTKIKLFNERLEGCTESNNYFSILMMCDRTTVSRRINKLSKLKYIKILMKYKGKECLGREIFYMGIPKKDITPIEITYIDYDTKERI